MSYPTRTLLSMTGKNIRKTYIENTYYHLYNRGVNKEPIFRDDEDYRVLLNLFKRILTKEPEKDSLGRTHRNLYGSIELNAYCLMPNHFHFLIFQKSANGLTDLFRSVSTSYAMYFNKKYDRVGHLFQGDLRAVMVDNDEYFRYISCYIHLNPKNYLDWKYSSLPYFAGTYQADWVCPQYILDSLGGSESYLSYLKELSSNRSQLSQLVDHIESYQGGTL